MEPFFHPLQNHHGPDVIQAHWVPTSCLSTPTKAATGPLLFADSIEAKAGLIAKEGMIRNLAPTIPPTFKSHVSRVVGPELYLESRRNAVVFLKQSIL